MNDDFEPLSNIDFLFGDTAISKRVSWQKEVNRTAAHLDVIDLHSKQIIADRGWVLFEIAYEYIGGFKSYLNAKDMAASAYYIRAVYDGKLNSVEDFDVDKCYAIATFNQKFGLKLTGMAKNFVTTDKMKTSAAVKKLQKDSYRISWFECSGKAESFVMANGGRNYIVDPKIIKEKVYPNKDVVILDDGIHYTRGLTIGGEVVKKVAVGTIKI